MKTVFCLRHVGFEDLGSFQPILEDMGYDVIYQDAWTVDFASLDAHAPDLLIVLGGPIGVYQNEEYPFLTGEIALLEKRLTADLPTLGVCLGSQLMARALGALVYPAAVKEIGWSPLVLSKAGTESCLCEFAPELTPVLHWHGDTFDLPRGATHLASTADCRNQAFSWGRNGLALQFHSEVTQQGLESWFIGHCAEIMATPGINVNTLRKDAARWSETLTRQSSLFFRGWLGSLEA